MAKARITEAIMDDTGVDASKEVDLVFPLLIRSGGRISQTSTRMSSSP
jgi:hypothetical protein